MLNPRWKRELAHMNKPNEKKPVFQHVWTYTKQGYLNYNPALRQWVITTNPNSGEVLASRESLYYLLNNWRECRMVEDYLTGDQLRVFKAWIKSLGCPETDYRLEEHTEHHTIIAGSSLHGDIEYRLEFPK